MIQQKRKKCRHLPNIVFDYIHCLIFCQHIMDGDRIKSFCCFDYTGELTDNNYSFCWRKGSYERVKNDEHVLRVAKLL